MNATAEPKLAFDLNDPLDTLSESYRRMERMLREILAIASVARGAELSPGEKQQMVEALRYCERAVPELKDDEVDSLYGRIRRAARPEDTLLLDALGNLTCEIKTAELIHARIHLQTIRWITEGSLRPKEVAGLIEALELLAATYAAHAEILELEVMPLARKLLTTDALGDIGGEIADRRWLDANERPSMSGAYERMSRSRELVQAHPS